jgi:hypothetical protein
MTDYTLAFYLVNEQSSHDYEPLWTESGPSRLSRAIRACARHGVLPRNRGKAQYLRDRNALQRRRCASAIRARPAWISS